MIPVNFIRKLSGLTGLVFILQQPLVQAQEAFAERLPERARWTVEIEPDFLTRTTPGQPVPLSGTTGSEAKAGKSESENPPKQLKSITVEKVSPIYHEVHAYTDGSTRERWVVKGFQVMESAEGSGALIRISPNPFSPEYSDYSKSDFPEFSWVKPEALLEEIEIDGVPMRVYATEIRDITGLRAGAGETLAKMAPAGTGAGSRPKIKVKAYISKVDGRPFGLEVDGSFKKWRVDGQAPTGPLVLPPAIAAEFKAWNERSVRYKKPALP